MSPISTEAGMDLADGTTDWATAGFLETLILPEFVEVGCWNRLVEEALVLPYAIDQITEEHAACLPTPGVDPFLSRVHRARGREATGQNTRQ